MKNIKLISSSLAALLISCAAGAEESGADKLAEAHLRFKTGEYRNMTFKIREALEQAPPGGRIEAEALSFLEDIYVRTGGNILLPDATIPDAFVSLRAIFDRVENSGKAGNRLAIEMRLEGTERPRKITVSKHAGPAFLDTSAGKGKIGAGAESGQFQVAVRLPDAFRVRGLYEMRIELENGDVFDSWFILDQMKADASPRILTQNCQVFGTGTPTIEWQDFKSSSSRAYETRTVELSLDGARAILPSTETRATVGAGSLSTISELKDGVHGLRIAYRETRPFGFITLARGATSEQRLVVAHGTAEACR